jgi:hypothetical protein
MVTINVAKDFSTTPGARNYGDGEFSGEEFYDTILKPKFHEALESGVKLKIVLDGTDGIASSFLNEAFRRLGGEFGPDVSWQNLVLISDEVPKYIKKVKEALYEVH